jgi:hypothetical protein
VQELVRGSSTELDRGEFLAGANDGVVGADLQTRLKAITEAGGARLHLVQTLPSVRTGTIKYIGARIELVGTLATIHRAIYAVESEKPYLFITAATLKISSTNGEPILSAQLDIIGALRSERDGP